MIRLTRDELNFIKVYQGNKGKRWDACDELGITWEEYLKTFDRLRHKVPVGIGKTLAKRLLRLNLRRVNKEEEIYVLEK